VTGSQTFLTEYSFARIKWKTYKLTIRLGIRALRLLKTPPAVVRNQHASLNVI